MNKFTMFLCLFMFLMVTSSEAANHDGRKVYIVYMGAMSPTSDNINIKRHHFSLLRSATGKSYTPGLIVTNYGKTFDGFAAWLTEEESKKLSAMPGVVSVFPSKKLKFNRDVDVDEVDDGVIDLGLKTQHLAPL